MQPVSRSTTATGSEVDTVLVQAGQLVRPPQPSDTNTSAVIDRRPTPAEPRWYFGGRSEDNAARTVFRAIPD